MSNQRDVIRVFVVDDHPMVRSGLKFFMESFEDLLWVGEASDGLMAIHLCKQTKPDIVLMDLFMPSMTGIEATNVICRDNPDTQVIIMSNEGNEDFIMEAFRAGATNYIVKDITAKELASLIHLTHNGKITLSTAATRALVSSVTQPQKQDYQLTQREYEVLTLLVKGFRNREIGEKLFISNSTVRNHTSRILKKFQVTSRTEAVALALKQEIIY